MHLFDPLVDSQLIFPQYSLCYEILACISYACIIMPILYFLNKNKKQTFVAFCNLLCIVLDAKNVPAGCSFLLDGLKA